MMIDCSINAFRRIWQKYPENLFRFPLDILTEGMNDCHEAKVAVIAELFTRVFLSANQESDEAQIINRNLPDGELEDFLSLFPGPHFNGDALNGNLWTPGNEFSRCCLAAVRRRFQLLFKADGLIPVYCGSASYWIPFHFFNEGHDVGVYDLRRSKGPAEQAEITEWSECARRLGVTSSIMIHCSCVGGLRMSGVSLMLPLQLAWWRKKGELPEYNVFRLVSTGAFDSNMRLCPVATEEKILSLKTLDSLLDYRFIYPESQNENPEARNVKILPSGMNRGDLISHVRKIAEQLDHLDLNYALRKIDGMDREVRLGNYSRWDVLLLRLKKAALFDQHNNTQKEAYLVNLILQSEANCHSGNTEEGRRLNERARNYASKQGSKFQKLLLRLEIDNLVLLQDMEKFTDVLEYVNQEKLLEQLQELQDDDLWMRYYGTMGQAHAYGTLERLSGFSKESALDYFEKALEKAEAIGEIPEIAHDKNYIHLFYALFEPGTDDETEAYKQASNIISHLKETDEPNAIKNLYYLKRSQTLAWYRQLLTENKVPVYEVDASIKRLLRHDDEGADDWLRACVGKYLGALEAAKANDIRKNGDDAEALKRQKSAEDYFRNAMDAIQAEKSPGIKTLIKATVYAEAYRSLGEQKALEKARELIDTIPVDFICGSLPAWKAYIDNPDNDFPGLSYWY